MGFEVGRTSFTTTSGIMMDVGVPATESGGQTPARALLPDPTQTLVSSGDFGAELALLVLESAREDKEIGRSIRDAEERAQRTAEDSQLRLMREKSESAYAAGLAGGFASVASGLLSAAGAGVVGRASARDTNQALRSAAPGAQVMKTPVTLPAVQVSVDASVKLTEAGGKIATAAFQHSADDAGNEATHQEMIAGRHKRAAEDAREQLRDTKDLINRTIAFYKDFTAAKTEAQRAAFLRA